MWYQPCQAEVVATSAQVPAGTDQERASQPVVELDEERKAAMVSNLLVILCSEQATQQVVNTGSRYQ